MNFVVENDGDEDFAEVNVEHQVILPVTETHSCAPAVLLLHFLYQNITVVSRRHFWGTLVQSVDAASLHLETILPVLLWMELSGTLFWS